MAKELIRLSDCFVQFDDDIILDHINLYINDKEFLTLLGPSGCGKTTTLRLIGGFLKPTSGEVLFDGAKINDVPPHKRAVNTVFQKYALFPHLNVFENIAFGLRIPRTESDGKKQRKVKLSEAEIQRRVMEMLEVVNLKGFEKRSIASLSGGQQQRVSIARALVRNPAVILADEPTGALDSHTGREVIGMLQQLHREGHTVVLITHDNSIAVQAERIIRLEDGQVVYDGDAHAPEAVVQPTLSGEAAQEEAK